MAADGEGHEEEAGRGGFGHGSDLLVVAEPDRAGAAAGSAGEDDLGGGP